MKQFTACLDGKNLKIAIVVSRFNEFITEKLATQALTTLKENAVEERNITLCWVPGAHEIPIIVQQLAIEKKYDAIIALGCVIRGATLHFELVAGECSKGLSSLALTYNIPITHGVLAVENLKQARERSAEGVDNKGAEAALAALETANLVKMLKGQ